MTSIQSWDGSGVPIRRDDRPAHAAAVVVHLLGDALCGGAGPLPAGPAPSRERHVRLTVVDGGDLRGLLRKVVDGLRVEAGAHGPSARAPAAGPPTEPHDGGLALRALARRAPPSAYGRQAPASPRPRARRDA